MAQNALGSIYADGLGVTQDYAAAMNWYSKAAAQGLALAQYNLGIMHGRGQGVPQDYRRSARGRWPPGGRDRQGQWPQRLGRLFRSRHCRRLSGRQAHRVRHAHCHPFAPSFLRLKPIERRSVFPF